RTRRPAAPTCRSRSRSQPRRHTPCLLFVRCLISRWKSVSLVGRRQAPRWSRRVSRGPGHGDHGGNVGTMSAALGEWLAALLAAGLGVAVLVQWLRLRPPHRPRAGTAPRRAVPAEEAPLASPPPP